jgi:hypothetical protein
LLAAFFDQPFALRDLTHIQRDRLPEPVIRIADSSIRACESPQADCASFCALQNI